MPGYGAVYLLFRWMMDRRPAMDLVMLLQILLSAGCTVALMRCAQLLGAGGTACTAVFLIAALGLWTNSYDLFLLTESFCISAVVFSFLFYLRACRGDGRRPLLISGALMAWAVFLKLVCGNYLMMMAAGLLLRKGAPVRQRLVHAGLFVLPFAAADVPWTVRNALVNHRFAPLTNGWFLNEGADVYADLSRMLMGMGGNVVFWSDPDADIRWFNAGIARNPDGTPIANDRPATIPSWWATSGCTMDTLALLARTNLTRQDSTLGAVRQQRDTKEVMRLCRSCLDAFRRERPFEHQVTARLRCLKLFVINPGVPYPFQATFGRMPWYLKGFKLAHMALYALVLLGASIAAARAILRPGEGIHRLLAVLFVSGLLVIPFVIRYTENRYMAPVWPFAVLCALLLLPRRFFIQPGTRT
jgi:hypothetical protein